MNANRKAMEYLTQGGNQIMEEENNSRFNIWQNAKMSMSMGQATVMSNLAFMTFDIKAFNNPLTGWIS